MNTKRILVLLLACATIMGAVGGFYDARGMHEPAWWNMSSSLLFLGLIFAWYHMDSNLHAYKRSIWLNGGILALAVVALPAYVIHRSASGTRFAALLRLLGFSVLLLLCAAIGATIGAFLS